MTKALNKIDRAAESASLHEPAATAKSTPTLYITTSWDDGHPLDLRVAELLSKYGIRGTFYVPKGAEKGSLTVGQMRELSRSFELGAHTLHHIVLTSTSDQEAWQEIVGSKMWLEDVIGLRCVLFCPPQGQYASRHLGMIRKAGYQGLRSVELCSLNIPLRRAGLFIIPTTVQAYPHRYAAYARNAVKRAAFSNLWRFVLHGHSTEWPCVARGFLRQAVKVGGVFHVWGHSWELQETGQWQRLEDVLQLMKDCAGVSFTNGQLCRQEGVKPRT